ncbi:MAG: phosphoenolpyruvate carboxykinase (ATP), partial [Rhodospirillales bacterium]|nr:phosphoenolpyruvate carboxykinase (ATP) [Rhodospirillales bacterium]
MTMDSLPLSFPAKVNHNAGDAELLELAIARGEGRFASTGALAVETGVHTGRSVQDKYIVRDASTEKAVWWDNNKAMTPEQFELLWGDFREHAKSCELFVQDLHAGADPAHRLNARIFTEYAWHAAFIRALLRRPQPSELAGFDPQFTVINL